MVPTADLYLFHERQSNQMSKVSLLFFLVDKFWNKLLILRKDVGIKTKVDLNRMK